MKARDAPPIKHKINVVHSKLLFQIVLKKKEELTCQ